ncbi:hypothetical protein MMC30_002005 [Trapelia coarctata]|nr:hypothetical protein [Trapelia coarctata]
MDAKMIEGSRKLQRTLFPQPPTSSIPPCNHETVSANELHPDVELRKPSVSTPGPKMSSGTGLRGILKKPSKSFYKLTTGVKRKAFIDEVGETKLKFVKTENERSISPTPTSRYINTQSVRSRSDGLLSILSSNIDFAASDNLRPVKRLHKPSASVAQGSKTSSSTGLRGILKKPTPSFYKLVPGVKRKKSINASGESEHTFVEVENEERSAKRLKFTDDTVGEGTPAKEGPRGRSKEDWDPEILEVIDQYVAEWIERRGELRKGHKVPMTRHEEKRMKRAERNALRERKMERDMEREFGSQPEEIQAQIEGQIEKQCEKQEQMLSQMNDMRGTRVYEFAEKWRLEVPSLLADGGRWAIALKKRNPPVDQRVIERLGLSTDDIDGREVVQNEGLLE